MKAAVHTRYGAPEVVEVQDIPIPFPRKGEVLIRVIASTVNRTDSGFRTAEYVISRLFSGLFRPRQTTLGCEFAGVIEAVGPGVTLHQAGERVFGFNDTLFGAHAEYMVLPQKAAMTRIPTGWSFQQAAPLCEGAHYALSAIRSSRIQKGEHALVYGATGSIGSAAVQLLKRMGVKVTAVVNTAQAERFRAMGFERVYDYQTEDFIATPQRFPFILDAVGKRSFGELKPLLTPNGVYISTELGQNAENIGLAIWGSFTRGPKVKFPIPLISLADVRLIAQWAEQGDFTPLIDRVYPLEHIVEAYRYVETGQKVGNVILRIADIGVEQG